MVAKELEDLNSTVFSKSFKAPSAWAEREVKQKMEKRAWEIEVRPPPANLQHTGLVHQDRQSVRPITFIFPLGSARQG